jgi:hypothetical protein
MSHNLVRIRPPFESMQDGMTYVDIIRSTAPYMLKAAAAKIFVGVADTNILLMDLAYAARTGDGTNLMHALRSGFLRVYGSETVRLEVPEKIDTLASRRRWDIVTMRSIWHTHVEPWIWFMDPAGLPPASPSVATTYDLDPDDGPTAQLVEVLNPEFVLSRDYRHLPGYELVGNSWTPIAEACRFKSKHDLVLMGGVFATAATAATAWAGIRETARIVGQTDRRILTGIIAAVAIALCFPKSRAWLLQRGTKFFTHVSDAVIAVAPIVFEHYFAIYERSIQAATLLEHESRDFHRPRRLRDFATAALARSAGSLTLEEISTSAAVLGYRARGSTSIRYLQNVLRDHPQLFRKQPLGHWWLAASRPNSSTLMTTIDHQHSQYEEQE